MSWCRAVVLSCDTDDCPARFGDGRLILSVSFARAMARKEGWYRDLYHGDCCPIHRPGDQR